MARKNEAEKAEAIESLRKYLSPGATVYTVLRHRSRSGMYRVIDAYVIVDNEPYRISYSAAKATGYRYDRRHEGVGIGGCGFDVGFELVHHLSYVMHGTKDTNVSDRERSHPLEPTPEKYRAGYSLKHRWLG